MTNNNDDDKKKKNGDWKKKVKCFGCERREISRAIVVTKNDGQDGGNKKEETYCSYVDASVTVDSWIVDSGASCHITPHRE